MTSFAQADYTPADKGIGQLQQPPDSSGAGEGAQWPVPGLAGPRRPLSDKTLEARTRVHWVMWRLIEEYMCFLRHWKWLIPNLIILCYGTTLLLPNLSYYRYGRAYGHQNTTKCQNDMINDPMAILCLPRRLQDLGHEMMPELKGEHGQVVDMPMFSLIATCGLSVFATLYRREEMGKPFALNMGRRFIVCFGLAHVLRLLCYLSTTVPGSAHYCLRADEIHPPQESGITGAKLIYKRKSTFGQNCGDLIFSGHMLIALFVMCTIKTYGRQCWGISEKCHRILFAWTFLPCIAQICMILSARHHYSVDVVISCYTAPALWLWHNTIVHPEPDYEPDQDVVADKVRWLSQKGFPGVGAGTAAAPTTPDDFAVAGGQEALLSSQAAPPEKVAE